MGDTHHARSRFIAVQTNAKTLGLTASEFDVSDVLPGEDPWIQINDGARVLFQGTADRAVAFVAGYGACYDARKASQ